MGFYGTRKERINTLRVYMALVVIAFVVQLALGAVALGRVADMESAMFDAWQEVCAGFYLRPINLIQISLSGWKRSSAAVDFLR